MLENNRERPLVLFNKNRKKNPPYIIFKMLGGETNFIKRNDKIRLISKLKFPISDSQTVKTKKNDIIKHFYYLTQIY